MKYKRMAIEVESPEEYGYDKIKYNLSESSVTDRTLGDLELQIPDLKLFYNEHKGSPSLRELVVADEPSLNKDNVLITGGAAGALFIIATSQLNREDHLIVVKPNYATNLETPRAIGCDISFVHVALESGFQLDISTVSAAVRPNTRMISVTAPHNPTGTIMSRSTLEGLVKLSKDKACLLLVDETYADITYEDSLPIAASLGDHVLTVASLSKSYGVPGIRLGWIITKNEKLLHTFLAAKEQISITGSVIDEWIAEQVLARKTEILNDTISEMHIRREMVESWIKSEPLLEWVKPTGGVVCFPHMIREPSGGTGAFYERLLKEYKTYVGPGHWFEMDDTFFRIGYGWPTREELQNGLQAISKALRYST